MPVVVWVLGCAIHLALAVHVLDRLVTEVLRQGWVLPRNLDGRQRCAEARMAALALPACVVGVQDAVLAVLDLVQCPSVPAVLVRPLVTVIRPLGNFRALETDLTFLATVANLDYD